MPFMLFQPLSVLVQASDVYLPLNRHAGEEGRGDRGGDQHRPQAELKPSAHRESKATPSHRTRTINASGVQASHNSQQPTAATVVSQSRNATSNWNRRLMARFYPIREGVVNQN